MDVTLEIFANELVELWNPGITINGIVYRIGLVSAIFDGKGFEQVTKTQGSASLEGCNACDFPGFWFGHGKSGSVVYPFYSRYTSAVNSVPICAVHWINFRILHEKINCSIGRIPKHWWNNLSPHPTLKERDFISFSDLQPSRYALSYVPQSNERVDYIEAAFIALDSEKIGEHVNDAKHVDFGDNKFPYFLGNKKNKEVEEEIFEFDEDSYLSKEQIDSLKKYIPQSILSFLSTTL